MKITMKKVFETVKFESLKPGDLFMIPSHDRENSNPHIYLRVQDSVYGDYGIVDLTDNVLGFAYKKNLDVIKIPEEHVTVEIIY